LRHIVLSVIYNTYTCGLSQNGLLSSNGFHIQKIQSLKHKWLMFRIHLKRLRSY